MKKNSMELTITTRNITTSGLLLYALKMTDIDREDGIDLNVETNRVETMHRFC